MKVDIANYEGNKRVTPFAGEAFRVEIITEHGTFQISESEDGICISDGGDRSSTLVILPKAGNMVHVATLDTAREEMLAQAQSLHRCWLDKYLSPMQASSKAPLDNEERTILRNLHRRYKNWKAAQARK